MLNETIVNTTPSTADIDTNCRGRQAAVPSLTIRSGPAATELNKLIEFEMLCGQAEGRSRWTIELTVLTLRKLRDFLCENCLPTDLSVIGAGEIRGFILYLQGSKCFSRHPYARCQDRTLSRHTVNIYLRSLRAAWN